MNHHFNIIVDLSLQTVDVHLKECLAILRSNEAFSGQYITGLDSRPRAIPRVYMDQPSTVLRLTDVELYLYRIELCCA